MTDKGAETLGFLIFMGLMLNGCLSSTGKDRVEVTGIGPREARILSSGMREASCIYTGGDWSGYNCKRENSK